MLEYDDVMNAQRSSIQRRRHALHGERLKVDIANMMYDTCELVGSKTNWQKISKNFEFELIRYFSISAPVTSGILKIIS